MTRIHSFNPIAGPDARILILGSMPGRASLEAHRYYAHPQNSFWRIMSQLLQVDADTSYEERVELVKTARIAIWDVLHSCIREGSLDSNIEADTLIANDFQAFFQAHTQISHVFFNGAKAEACFKQHVLGKIAHAPPNYFRLPSTSPANASATYARKLEQWRAILLPLKVREQRE